MARYLRVHESQVQSYIREGGEVAELLNDVAKGVKAYSVAYISSGKGGSRRPGPHVRSGRLLNGQFWNRSKLEGPLQGVALAGSSAKHTTWFMGGTPDVIKGKPHMVVPRNPRQPHTNTAFAGAGSQKLAGAPKKSKRKGVMRKDTVRGQWAKPFLVEGLAASLASQRLK